MTHKVLLHGKTYSPLIIVTPGVIDGSFTAYRELLCCWVLGFISSQQKPWLQGILCTMGMTSHVTLLVLYHKEGYRGTRYSSSQDNQHSYAPISPPPHCTLTFPWHRSPYFHISHCCSASSPTQPAYCVSVCSLKSDTALPFQLILEWAITVWNSQGFRETQKSQKF